jgi:hypothetical protein
MNSRRLIESLIAMDNSLQFENLVEAVFCRPSTDGRAEPAATESMMPAAPGIIPP